MVASDDATAGILGELARWEDVLPSNVAVRIGIFPRQSERQIDATQTVMEVILVQATYGFKLLLQFTGNAISKNRDAVFHAFSISDDDLS